MTRLNTSPRSSGSLRRTVADVGGLLVIWSWIGWKLSRDAVSSVVDRGFAFVFTRVVGSEPIDERAMDWALENVVEGGVTP